MVERRPDGTTRGGQEPPDEVKDRPEQNATYDAVVDRGEVRSTEEDFVAAPDNAEDVSVDDPDERAARDAAATVRRHQRSNQR